MKIDFEFNGIEYSIDTDRLHGYDLVKGHLLFYRRRLFNGSYRRPRYAGYEDYIVEINSESYGFNTGQHTFTLKVLMPLENSNEKSVGDKILIKGRNLYPNCSILEEPDDEWERRCEKHERAKISKPHSFLTAFNMYDINFEDTDKNDI